MAKSAPEILSYFSDRLKIAQEKQLKELDLSVPWDTHENDKLHQIPPEVFSLTHLESLNLSGNEITTIPGEIVQLKNLTSLDIGDNKLNTIPQVITQLKQLKTLRVSLNGITLIPEYITELTNLTTLDLGLNKITSIPEYITELTNLVTLDLGENEVTSIPKYITELTHLENLDLSTNGLSEIPEYITELTNLKNLDLSRNRFQILPEFFSDLSNLAKLYLSRNNIILIPTFIGKLKKLTYLDLSHNKITIIPELLNQLTKLTYLDLSHNQIIAIPEYLTHLTSLTSLNVSQNKLEIIPDYIAVLNKLTKLDLSNNVISVIPESLTKLTNLASLNLQDNQLTSFPKEVTKLQKLTSLNLSRNQISSIPNLAWKVAKLQQLNLSSNQLTKIPATILKLFNLSKLALSDNQITTIPQSISKLVSLTNLDLGGNNIIAIPDTLGDLNQLVSLNLSCNNLELFPESITQLTNLKSLDLSENNLTTITDNLGDLINLAHLDLSSNKIKALPNSITKLNKLTNLSLEENEIELPPIEIVHQGIKSIRDYFFQLNEGEDYIYEAKLIIVGEGGVGKTSLAKKIYNPNYQLKQDELSTEGIDVLTWQFNLLDKQEQSFQVNIWDFGGQEIYHATHQFFLTKRSLYILVADSRKENTDFYYWMNAIELLADRSPILIIKNEKQDRHCAIDERRLRGEFTNLKEIIATNLKTERNLDFIVENIKHYIQQLPHVGTTLPKTWIDVRGKLEELKEQGENYIDLDDYVEICNQYGFAKYENALQLSQYLHDLGVCLHFQEDSLLLKTIILQPDWGTDAVYKVLDDDKVVRNFGRFSKQDLVNIWRDSKYQRMHNELLQLMIKFKLCYEIADSDNCYIAPQLLSLSQPEYEWNQERNILLRYSYEFMPKGIITKFIVEIHRLIQQELVWRSGVVLANDYAEAEIIEYYEKKEIRIRISGNHKRDLMAIITNELDRISQTYERIKFRKLIPCNCDICANNLQPTFYDLSKLKERITNQKSHIECSQPPYHQVNVLSLITDIAPSELKLQKNQNSPRQIVQNFYGNVEHATGNITGDYITKTSNVQAENLIRNIDINQGNYTENLEGDYVDQGDQDRSPKAILQETSKQQNSAPDTAQIETLLNQLNESVLAANLDQIDREDALEQIQAIAKAIPNIKQKKNKRKVKSSWGIMQDIAATLPSSSPMAIITHQLTDLIEQLF